MVQQLQDSTADQTQVLRLVINPHSHRATLKRYSVIVFSSLGVLAGWHAPASAEVGGYQATILQSKWQISMATPLECRMEQKIPGFGTGAFSSVAGKNPNLVFELKPLRPQAQIQHVSVRSIPPVWRPGVSGSGITNTKFYTQFDGEISGKSAWVMMDVLESGYIPSFTFRDWYHQNRPLSIGLSSVGFRPQYQKFLECMQTLLPYTLDDISFTVLNYQNNSNELTPYSQRRLNMIGEYLKADPQIDLVMLAAYTDTAGSKSINQTLSEKRAAAMKQFFVDHGIDAKRIKVEAYGEKDQIALNETDRGREINRRVVITLERWTAPELSASFQNKTAAR